MTAGPAGRRRRCGAGKANGKSPEAAHPLTSPSKPHPLVLLGQHRDKLGSQVISHAGTGSLLAKNAMARSSVSWAASWG
jgi:hypothetical protein